MGGQDSMHNTQILCRQCRNNGDACMTAGTRMPRVATSTGECEWPGLPWVAICVLPAQLAACRPAPPAAALLTHTTGVGRCTHKCNVDLQKISIMHLPGCARVQQLPTKLQEVHGITVHSRQCLRPLPGQHQVLQASGSAALSCCPMLPPAGTIRTSLLSPTT